MRAARAAGACLLALLALLSGGVAFADPPDIARFYGRYEGSATIGGEGREGEAGDGGRRDLAVTIAPEGERFRVDWVTESPQPDGSVKRKTYAIAFASTARPGIWAAAMRTDLFGHRVPLDPLKGDPYVWCRIDGDTLTLYAMTITDTGGYDLQVYARTLVAGGLRLDFTRLREGEPPRRLSALLKKVAESGKAD